MHLKGSRFVSSEALTATKYYKLFSATSRLRRLNEENIH